MSTPPFGTEAYPGSVPGNFMPPGTVDVSEAERWRIAAQLRAERPRLTNYGYRDMFERLKLHYKEATPDDRQALRGKSQLLILLYCFLACEAEAP